MTVQHASIPEAYLHESKGVSTATANTAYLANGSGSGTWRKILSTDLNSLTGDAGVADKTIVSNGSNGFKLVVKESYSQLSFSANATAFAVTAAADATLNTSAQYVALTGTGSPWSSEFAYNATVSAPSITCSVAGVYSVSIILTLSQFASATNLVGIKLRTGSVLSAGKSTVTGTAASASDQIVFNRMVSLAVGDVITPMVASSAAGNLIISDAVFTTTLVKAA